MIIVSDTTSLIALEQLEALHLLCKLFSKVLVPTGVMEELAFGSPDIYEKFKQFDCLKITEVEQTSRLASLLSILDEGEAYSIELAICLKLPLIIDERKGRQVANQLGVKVTGFAGLLIQATRNKILTIEDSLELLDQAIENGLRLSESLTFQVKTQISNVKS